MLRRLLIPLLGSGLLLTATAGSAFAKCESEPKPEFCSEVIASFDGSGGGMRVGTPQAVVVHVSQGEQPFDAIGVNLQFVNQQDGSRLDVPATATSTPGLWRAVVELPADGIWTSYAQVVTNTGTAYRIFMERLRVTLPPAPPVSKPVTAPPVSPNPPILPIALVLGGLAAAALGGVAIRARRRAPAPAGAAASAATADHA